MEKNHTTMESIVNNVVSFIPTGDFYYHKAMKALEYNHFDQAKKYLKRALELSPDDTKILVQTAYLKMEEESFLEALELLRHANNIEPNDPETVLFLAEVSANMGLAEDAINFATHYLEIEPAGEYREEAEEIIDIVTDILKEAPLEDHQGSAEKNYEQERARHLMETGDFESAIEILENLIAEYPDFWAAYNNLALAYFYKGEHEQARALLHEVLIGNYGNIHALCNLTVMSYYEQDDADELKLLTDTLLKLQPYFVEHRYKLGATLALIGQYEQAYKWLHSLKKRGYIGDAGYYFWLSHSAYFAGHDQESRTVWDELMLIDPSKEGLEPWANVVKVPDSDDILSDREYLIGRLEHEILQERLLGLFLLNKSPFKQELLAHPTLIDIDSYSTIEKLMLAYAMNHDFSEDVALASFYRAMEVLEKLYVQHEPITIDTTFLLQLWLVLFEKGLHAEYDFKNPTALAAATEYMFYAVREKVTKKEIAEWYGTTTKTLTKYVDELMQFLPIYD
ncbi:tetratricopeptide repeat protein [Kurthia huakuii]|uniref:tetratricopeptide repeat protein n=1 Tax=Kurthia huakuii TaxID=1421019 RepID=UPI000496BDDC|nr:tetratricopeptide repeat protein [Kurthia huakuii]MBM7699632.1 tetratricopeptide (TPR) repeat protein [Kurthia huakuii]